MIHLQGDLFGQPIGYTRPVSVLPKVHTHVERVSVLPERMSPEVILQNRLAVALLEERSWKKSQTDNTQLVCELSTAELRSNADALTAAAHAIFAQLGIPENGIKIETLPPGNRLLPEKIRCTLPSAVFVEIGAAMKTLRDQALINKAGASR